MIGRTLKLIIGQSNFFLDLLSRECTLRFISAKPNVANPKSLEPVLPEPRGYDEAIDLFEAQLKSAKAEFEYLSQQKTKGRICYRQVEYISNISFVKVEDESGEGKIMVELMPYQNREFQRPHFELSSSDPNPHWYNFFSETCEEIWRRATQVDLDQGQETDEGS